MDEFLTALFDKADNSFIPEGEGWYAPLIEEWALAYSALHGRTLKGEWFFRKILEGTAIEDIFICPSRDTKDTNPQPDGEYGVVIGMYNQSNHCYDMTYVCTKYTKRLTVRKVNDRIECSVVDHPNEKWCFSDITSTTFHWQNEVHLADGTVQVNCEVFGHRVN